MDATSHLGNFFQICVTRALTQTYFSGWGGAGVRAGGGCDGVCVLKQRKLDERRLEPLS